MFNRREPLSSVSRALLSFLTILLIVFTIPSVFVLPSELILFQPGPYKRALLDLHFYDNFPRLLAQMLIETHALPSSPGLDPQAAKYLNQDDYTRFFGMVFPPEWVQGQVEGVIDHLFAYLNFQSTDLALVIDVKPVKDRLNGDVGQQIATQMVESWPDCTGDTVGQVLGLMLSGQLQGIPVCRPPQMVRPAFETMVTNSIRGLASSLPDQFDLAGPLTSSEAQPGLSGPLLPNYYTVFRWYTVLRWLFRFLPVIALGVLLWIVLISIRSTPDLLLWSGQPLFSAGLIALVLSLLGAFVINPLLASLFSNAFPLLPAAFRTVVSDMMLEVTSRYALWSAFVAFAVIAASLILILSSRFFERQE